jgi:NTP pyrophosphatase (non-canonical NTP hydrolase)
VPRFVIGCNSTDQELATKAHVFDAVHIDTVFADLICAAERTEREHGFGKQTFGEDIALIHSELSEALEEFRAARRPNELHFEEEDKPDKPCGIPSELADVVIRIFGMCARYDIDLADAIVRKMKYNESRPFRHGGKTL